MKKPLAATLGITAALLTLGRGPADAVSTILQPERVTTNIEDDTVNAEVNNLINQSGLSQSYTSRETPWSEVSNIVGSSNFIGIWATRNVVLSQVLPAPLTFDLGDEFLIQGLALWRANFGSDINEFELFVDNDDNFENDGRTSLGTFNASSENVSTFSFTATETRYVHLNIHSTFNSADSGARNITAGEVAFELVPFEFGHLPGIIFAVSLGGIHYFRNKRGGKDK